MPSFRSHAVRFYNARPEAITCLAHSQASPSLAVGRADSSVEIWDTQHNLVKRSVIPPPPSSAGRASVECLAWGGSTLYSCGLHGQVVTYDLEGRREKRRHLVTSGPAWCLAIDSASVHLAVGTEEGFVCLFTITEEGLDYVKVLDRQEGRILCLAWHPDCRHIVTGSVDTIRVWDTSTGHPTARMTTGRVEKAKETIVWCVKVTEDFTVISGDSRGKTSFWNGKLGTLVESVQSHKGDVLTLALSSDQATAYSTGVDPTLMHFQVIVKADGRRKWVKSLHRVIASHDVRAIVSHGDRLYSGGVDTYLQCSQYPARSVVRLPSLPCPSQGVTVAPESRLLLLSYPHSLELWSLGTSHNSTAGIGAVLPLHKEPVKLLSVDLPEGQTLLCSHVSSNGGYLSYSTNIRVRLLRVNLGTDSEPPTPSLTRVKIDTKGRVAHQMSFFSDSSCPYLLLCLEDGSLHTYRLSGEKENASLVSSLDLESSGLCGPVANLSVSTSLCCCADSRDNLVLLGLQGGILSLAAKLPSYREASLSCLSLSPSSGSLLLAYSNMRVLEVDVSTGRYSEFSNQLMSRLPRAWLGLKTAMLGCTYIKEDLLLLHSHSCLAIIDKTCSLPEPGAKLSYSDPRATPESSSDSMSISQYSNQGSLSPSSTTRDLCETECGLRLSRKYNHLLAFSHLQGDEVVAVEVKPALIEEQLPPSIKIKKFGGS